MHENFQKNIQLSSYTTIGLGGNAKYFADCSSVDSITNALKFAEDNNLKVQVISGGSNIIFSDEGFDGMVLKIDIKGIEFEDEKDFIKVKVYAGENWDDLVKQSIQKGLSGIECLSGIPGSVGAAPIQNVGAYGQEVKDTIASLKALNRSTFELKEFSNEECKFDYRQSRFKSKDKDRYIITEVTFRFKKFCEPEIKYPELQKYVESDSTFSSLKTTKEKINEVRKAVLTLRKKKSMVIHKDDPNSKSCGSFFINPFLNKDEFLSIKKKYETIPYYYISGDFYKVPAAWLVEQAGFHKGFRLGGAGISSNHSLAIINCGGTTKDILELAAKIESGVFKKFQIKLQKEPEVV